MTHNYRVAGMTCSGCEAKVKSSLLTLEDVTSVEVSKDTNTAVISMNKHIPLAEFRKALGGDDSKYQIHAIEHNEAAEQVKSWFGTYKPLLILFGLILMGSVVGSVDQFIWYPMLFMQYFMAGFFLSFSYFKLINLNNFADSYAMYDIIAKRFRVWAYIYAFIELSLGVAYLVNFYPIITNSITFIVMSISIIGVLKSVLNKRQIRCACLGAVFNLPMSTVTIIEDALMILMSAIMILLHFINLN